MRRIVAHLDMDAFFAAIEERDRPKFKGMPIVVGADPMEGRGRGVVSTANYKAREYGIRSAIPISLAWQISEAVKKQRGPAAVFLSPNFRKYEKSSSRIVQIVKKFSSLVEPASIDEMYFDLSFCKSYKEAEAICKQIKSEIKEEEKLTCSIGIGPNKLIAKIASDLKKPDGLTIVKNGDEEKFLESFSIRKIPGIGSKTEEYFKAKKVILIKDLKKFSKSNLKEMLGKRGEDLYFKIRGIDNSPLVEEFEIKSIGEQGTFLEDTLDAKFIINRMNHLCENVFKRFKERGFKTFKSITITVRFVGFETKTRSRTLVSSSKPDLKAIQFEALKLITPFFDKRENPKRKLIRLIGIRIGKLN